MPAELSVDQQALRALARALREEGDGKQLRRDLTKSLRGTMDRAKADARSNLMGIATSGASSASPPLRASLVPHIKVDVRLSGRSTGVRMRTRRRGPRGFDNAPKALNNPKGWRHRVFGRDVWVEQRATPKEWFDRATRQRHAQLRDAVLEAMNKMAERLARRGPFK